MEPTSVGAVGLMYMNVYYIVVYYWHSLLPLYSSYDVSKSSPTRSTLENTF